MNNTRLEKVCKRITPCCVCGKDIDTETQIFYVFIDKDKTNGNQPYCTSCYLYDIAEKMELDPSTAPIYHKNFIRMNK